ncbi:unnamed protein product [Paramecium primaurelia]|uniref:Uncharacterized protein n=2 Tax=Paramecium TaxID=5884 RepID=A0A8S1XIL0_9CILI|nr:unnamed protein product [Paramecium primaurelia]CAD8200322.1 unnamed protein product [Paramecium pentaurelia]
MLQKSTKLTRCQRIVQGIKDDMQSKVQQRPLTNRSTRLKNLTTESSPMILDYIPLPENPKLDAMMDNIKRILDKHKKQPSAQQELKSILSANQVKQIYGSRRHMIEVRFKEFYNSRLASPQIHSDVVVDVSPQQIDIKSSRLIQYQRRIGLVKKRDLLEERIQEIGQRYRTKQ